MPPPPPHGAGGAAMPVPLRSWYTTHLRMGFLASTIWLFCFALMLFIVGYISSTIVAYGPEETFGWYRLMPPLIWSSDSWITIILLWGSSVTMLWMYKAISSTREARYGNALFRMLGSNTLSEQLYLRPVLVFKHGVAGVMNSLIISKFTGNTWLTPVANTCWDTQSPRTISTASHPQWVAVMALPVTMIVITAIFGQSLGMTKLLSSAAIVLSVVLSATIGISWHLDEVHGHSQHSCYVYSDSGLFVFVQSFAFGLFYGAWYLYKEKNHLKFDAIHQKVVLRRIVAKRNSSFISGFRLAARYIRVVLPISTGLKLVLGFNLEMDLAIMLGQPTSVPTAYASVVGWLHFFLVAGVSASIWEFIQAILEISLTQLRYPDHRSMEELIDAISQKDDPLLRHLGYLQLDRRFRYSAEDGLFTTGEPEIWKSALAGCSEILKEVQDTAAPTLFQSAMDIPEDYTHRPFDDPANIYKTVPANPGWPSVVLSRDQKQPSWNTKPQRSDNSLVGRILWVWVWLRRALGRWSLYLQLQEAWYRPNISLVEAKALLQLQRNGTFIVHKYTPQRSETKLFRSHEARTLTVVRDTHPDPDGQRGVTSGGSTWSGTILNEPGKGYFLFGSPQEQVNRFLSLEVLVQHYSKEPYEVDFAGGKYKLLDITKPGPMYSATVNALQNTFSKLLAAIRQQKFVAFFLNKRQDDYRRELWYDFSCVIWASRCIGYAAAGSADKPQTIAAAVIREQLNDVVIGLLRTLAAVDFHISKFHRDESGSDWPLPSFPSNIPSGRRLPASISNLPNEDFGCRTELHSSLCRVIRAYPEQVARMLREFQPPDLKLLNEFLSKEPIHFVLKRRFNDVTGTCLPASQRWVDMDMR